MPIKKSDYFDLNDADLPMRPITRAATPTDRYNQVAGYWLNLNQ